MKIPQLHIRDLFWLVALVAVSCGWWVDHTRTSIAHRRYLYCKDVAEEYQSKLRKLGYQAEFDEVAEIRGFGGVESHPK